MSRTGAIWNVGVMVGLNTTPRRYMHRLTAVRSGPSSKIRTSSWARIPDCSVTLLVHISPSSSVRWVRRLLIFFSEVAELMSSLTRMVSVMNEHPCCEYSRLTVSRSIHCRCDGSPKQSRGPGDFVRRQGGGRFSEDGTRHASVAARRPQSRRILG